MFPNDESPSFSSCQGQVWKLVLREYTNSTVVCLTFIETVTDNYSKENTRYKQSPFSA